MEDIAEPESYMTDPETGARRVMSFEEDVKEVIMQRPSLCRAACCFLHFGFTFAVVVHSLDLQGGWTPLHLACYNGHAALVATLLRDGAVPDAAHIMVGMFSEHGHMGACRTFTQRPICVHSIIYRLQNELVCAISLLVVEACTEAELLLSRRHSLRCTRLA